MPILKIILSYLLTFLVFLGIDLFWLTILSKNFYAKYLGFLMAEKANLLPAFLFYLLFVAGIMYFVIFPAIKSGSLLKAILGGVFFGLVTYATYDLTNLATIKNWPLRITIIDLLWGMLVSTIVSMVGFWIVKLINNY